MCIAIWSPVDALIPKKTVLKNCFRNNPEGAGFARYNPETEKWECKKGLMTWKAFWRAFNANTFTPVDEVIIHFRVSTSGKLRSPDCTHPFPVVDDVNEMMHHDFETENIVMHNGVVGQGDGDASDSMVAVRDYIEPLQKYIDEDKILDILEELLLGSKCRWFIAKKNTVYLIGDWHEIDGTHYSNYSYKYVKPKVIYKHHGGAFSAGGGLFDQNWTHTNINHEAEIVDCPELSIYEFMPGNSIEVSARLFDWHQFDKHMVDVYTELRKEEEKKKLEKKEQEEALVDNVIHLPWGGGTTDLSDSAAESEAPSDDDLTEVYDANDDCVRALIDADGDIVWDSDGSAYNDDHPGAKEIECPACGDHEHCMDSPFEQTDPITNIVETVGDSLCVRCGAVFVDKTGEIVRWDVEIKDAHDEAMRMIEGDPF
jgi:hypothetical protein